MKLLAIESSSLVASVALLQDDVIVAEYTMNHKITHSQTLLPMLDEIINMSQTDKKTIDAIAISGGPGSYTGLRIGSATAKGLGFALQIPVIHVPTLQAMAYNAYGYKGIVCPIMDARRGQVYTGIYEFVEDKMITHLQDCAIELEQLVEKLRELTSKTEQVMFIGDGIPVCKSTLEKELANIFKVEFAPANMNRQRAASVAVLGAQMYKEGKAVEAQEHLPDYFRLSQAERELKEKMETNV